MAPEWAEVEIAVPATAHHGEGPVWDQDRQRLLWVDIPAGVVHAYVPDSGAMRSWQLGRDVGCVAPLRGEGMVCGVREGFAVLDEGSGVSETVAALLERQPSLRMNDGACDPVGRFWAGSMAFDETPGAGALYRLDLDGTVAVVLSGVTVSNGLGWSPDGTRCYYVDTGTGGVDAFDYDVDDGALGARRRLVDLPAGQGKPDGLTVDADGCVWVATWTGGQVRRFDPAGRHLQILQLPVSQVTSCAFGGSDLRELYITTSRFGLTAGQLNQEPLAGAVFVADVGVAGTPSPPCGYLPTRAHDDMAATRRHAASEM